MYVSPFIASAAVALVVFAVLWTWMWLSRKGAKYVFFDPQDCVHFGGQGRQFPLSAAKTTFEPMLKHYIGVTQLLVTVAAASIAFGGDKNLKAPVLVVLAKSLLAWSIFYGLLFCAFLLYRYDEYTQDRTSYTRRWYSTVEALGFSTLLCFILGYLVWAWGLSA
jgi:hypothetical protein